MRHLLDGLAALLVFSGAVLSGCVRSERDARIDHNRVMADILHACQQRAGAPNSPLLSPNDRLDILHQQADRCECAGRLLQERFHDDELRKIAIIESSEVEMMAIYDHDPDGAFALPRYQQLQTQHQAVFNSIPDAQERRTLNMAATSASLDCQSENPRP